MVQTSTLDSPRPAAEKTRVRRGWQPLMLFLPFPLWWVLGLSNFVWPLLAIPLFLALTRWRQIRSPPGFGFWLMFLGWMLISGIELDSGARVLAWTFRASIYVAATVFLLYVYNGLGQRFGVQDVLGGLTGFWAIVVIGGMLGVLLPHFSATSPFETVLPTSISSNSFVHDLVHLRFAQNQGFLGFNENRPVGFFTYTNNWGAAFGFLVPLAIAGLRTARTEGRKRLLKVLLILSIVPIVYTLDRGLWLGLVIGAAYATLRLVGQRGAQALVTSVAALTLVVIVVFVTPLGRLVSERFAHPHSNNVRQALYTESVHRVVDSPLLGYGGPRPSATGGPKRPSVGTQSEVFLILFSHGFPGLAFYTGFMLTLILRTRRLQTPEGFWIHVALIVVSVESFYYDITFLLPAIMTAAALGLREAESAARRPTSAAPVFVPSG